MSTITEISTAITHNVAALPLVGSNDRIYIINESDWNGNITVTGPTNGVITNLAPPGVGAYAYKWEGANGSVNFTTENVKYSFHDAFIHRLTIRVFDKTAANIAELVSLCQSGHIRVVVETNGGSANGGLFWMLGFRTGLSIVPGTQWDQSSTDEAGLLLELSTPEDEDPEPYYPYQVLVTNYATTVSTLDGLLS